MDPRFTPARLILATAALALGLPALAQSNAPIPPPRDPAVVLDAEYQRARAAGTNAALILFIARQPDSPLADQARVTLRGRTTPDPTPDSGPDGDILMAFDLARLSRDRAALDDFARLYAGHPLAAEAARPIWTRPG